MTPPNDAPMPDVIYIHDDSGCYFSSPVNVRCVKYIRADITRTPAAKAEAQRALVVIEQEELTYTASIYGGDPDGCSDYDSEITVCLKSLLGENVYKTIRALLERECGNG